jgi:hypothetical protein
VIARLIFFLALTLATWVVVAVPTRLIAGDLQAIYAGVALLVCAIPGLGTLTWALTAARQSPQQQMVAAFAGTGIRLIAVSALGWLLFDRIALLRQEAGFGVWVLLAYLFTLTLEIGIALRGQPATSTPGEIAR